MIVIKRYIYKIKWKLKLTRYQWSPSVKQSRILCIASILCNKPNLMMNINSVWQTGTKRIERIIVAIYRHHPVTFGNATIQINLNIYLPSRLSYCPEKNWFLRIRKYWNKICTVNSKDFRFKHILFLFPVITFNHFTHYQGDNATRTRGIIVTKREWENVSDEKWGKCQSRNRI